MTIQSFLILKSGYIYSVKAKQFISVILLFIVILSSIGYAGICSPQNETAFKNNQSATATQLIADNQEPANEFRENFKTIAVSNAHTSPYNIHFEASQFAYKTICFAQYDSYLHKRLSQNTSEKLFLNFGSLII